MIYRKALLTILAVVSITFIISSVFASHSTNVTVLAGNDLWTKAGETETFNFTIINNGADTVNGVTIHVPKYDATTMNYTVNVGTINAGDWVCSAYNISDVVEKIRCINSSVGLGINSQLNISFNAAARAVTTEEYSLWLVNTTGTESGSQDYKAYSYPQTGIDGSAPAVNEISINNTANISGFVNMTINITDLGSGINASRLKFLIGSEWVNMSLLNGNLYYNRTYDTNDISNGLYNITVNVSDAVGNGFQIVLNNTKVNNTISYALISTVDSTAYIGASDNDWKFEFNVTVPNSCRLKIRLDNWTTALGNATYNISIENNAVWKYIVGGEYFTYNVMNHYDNSQVVYVADDNDGSEDESITASFNLTTFIPSGSVGSTNWITNYYLKCQ